MTLVKLLGLSSYLKDGMNKRTLYGVGHRIMYIEH